MDLFALFTENFGATVSVLVALVMTVTNAINNRFTFNSTWKQVVSWVVSVVLTIGTYFLGLTTVGEPAWLSLILTGLAVGLVSNGFYDIDGIRKVVQWLTAFTLPASKKE